MRKARDPYFDLVKAVAIFMVVFCHVMWIAPVGTFPLWVDNFRVGVNMPIFFILSGYFAWPTIEVCYWQKLGQTIRSYFQPALFAGVTYTLLGVVIGSVDSSPLALVERLIRSVFVDPWFLTTLAECYVVLFVSFAVGRCLSAALFISLLVILVVVCCSPFIPGRIHMGCFTSMFPHFVFGAIVLRRLDLHLWQQRVFGMCCLCVFLAFVLLEGDVAKNGMSFYTSDSTIYAFAGLRSSLCFFLRPALGIVGSIGLMALLRIALDALPFLASFSKIGTLTLGIYIFHLWPLSLLRRVDWVGSSKTSVVVTAIVFFAVFSAVSWFLKERSGRFGKLIWGK